MKELYSNADDCLKLSRLLESKLKEKIEFWGSTYQEVISGKYYSLPYDRYDSYLEYRHDAVEFSYIFSEDEFLRISVGNSAYKKASIGHKLAVLSDLYEVISEKYGEPTVFYTLKEDDENSINLEWDFIQKEETIDAFKNGCRFEDEEIDDLIIISDEREKVSAYSLNKRTKEMISKTIGLPFELLYLVDENIEDFVLYKKGKVMGYPENVRVEGHQVATLESTQEKIKVKK